MAYCQNLICKFVSLSLLSLFYAAHFLIFYCCDSAKIKHYIAIAIECCSLLYWFFIILSHIKQQHRQKEKEKEKNIEEKKNTVIIMMLI